MRLNNKVALITGGTMGLARAMAMDLARHGADIAMVARNLGDDADAIREEIRSLDRKMPFGAGRHGHRR